MTVLKAGSPRKRLKVTSKPSHPVLKVLSSNILSIVL
jgi:hypothetical protein